MADHIHGRRELARFPAVDGAEHVVEKVDRMHADRNGPALGYVAFDQCQMFGVGELVLVDIQLEFAAVAARKGGIGDALDRPVMPASIGDQVRNRPDLEPMILRERDEVVEAAPSTRPRS